MNFALSLYVRLARAFPHEFKMVYGYEMTQLGEDMVKDIAKRHGIVGLIRLVLDIAMRLPIEYLSEMRQDLRYAARGLVKSPGFALVGIVSMGIGMGLTTYVYSAKLQLLLRALPAANASRLVLPERPVSYYYIEQYRDQKSLFTGVAAVEPSVPFNITLQNDVGAKPERVFGQIVSPDYFTVLGVEAARGRVLNPDQDKPGNAAVVVITDRFWRNRLKGSPDVIGQSIRVNGQPATIVGITPKDFNGVLPINPSEIFVPITAPAAVAPELANDVLHQRSARDFLAFLCLAPGVTIESAEAALDAITRNLDQQDASQAIRDDKGKHVTLVPGGTVVPLPRDIKPIVLGFFILLMGLIMTIACMNLANMLLARGANRRKELAIRLAVGASRFRIIRQMLTEGILLSLLGGLAGFAFGYALCVLKSQITEPSAIPTERDFIPDWHAVVFVFALSVACGVGFSLLPALRVTKADLVSSLKATSAGALRGYGRFGMRNLLMVTQVAGSLMLLLITGFLVIGISEVGTVKTKFDPNKMYMLSIDPMRQGYTSEKSIAFFEKLPDRLNSSGATHSIAFAAQPPFSIQDLDDPTPFTAEDSHVEISAVKETVGAGYFAALDESVAGRDFTDTDQKVQPDSSKTLPIILNESTARGFFGNRNAIGQRIRDDKNIYEVVGTVRNVSAGLAVKNIVYVPLTDRDFARPPAAGIVVMVGPEKGAESGTDALSDVGREIATIDPNLNIFNVRTFSEYLERSRSAERFAIDTYGGIGIFGLVLAAIGLAGVTAYAVAQRRKEIGIRVA